MLCASRRNTWGRRARRVIGAGTAIVLCGGGVGAAAADADPWDDGVRVSWVKEAGDEVRTMADPDLVIGITDDPGGSVVQAAAAADGHRVWSTRLPPSTNDARPFGPGETMNTGHGVVAVAGRAGLQVLDARSGRVLWHAGPEPTRTGENEEPRVRIDADAVYYSVPAGSEDEAVLRSFDRLTGAERWQRTTRIGLSGQDGALVAGDPCAWEVLSPATGAVRWRKEQTVDSCPIPHGSGIVTSGGLLAAPGTATVLRDLGDGHPVATLGSGTDARVIAAGDGLWIADQGEDHVAYDDAGAELWRRPRPEDPVHAHFGIRDGYVVMTEDDARSWVSTVYGVRTTILDARTGIERSSELTGAHVQDLAPGEGVPVLRTGARAVAIVPGERGAMVGPVYPAGVTTDGAVLRSGVPTRTAARTVTVTPDTPAGQTAECRLDDGAWQPCSGPWESPDLAAEGEHAVEVRTPGGPGMRHLFDVDRTGPAVEILRAPDPLVGPRAGSATVRFVASEAESTIECRIDDGPWDDCYGAEFPEGLRSGPHRMDLRATDRIGNRGPVTTTSWTEDHDRPAVTFDPRPYPVDGYEAEIPFTIADDRGGVRVRCELREVDDRTPLLLQDDCASPLRVAVPRMGDYRLTVVATDEALNVTTETKDVRFLAVADIDPQPAFEILQTRLGRPSPYWGQFASIRSTRRWPVSFDITMECRVRRADAPATGPWQECESTGFVPGQRLPDRDDRYVIETRGSDEAGRSGPTTELGFGLDRLPPPVHLTGGQIVAARAGESIHLPAVDAPTAGPDEAPLVAVRCEVYVGWTLDPSRSCDTTTTMPADRVMIQATAEDAAGNVAQVSRTIDAAPATGGGNGPEGPTDGGSGTPPDPPGDGPGTAPDPTDGSLGAGTPPGPADGAAGVSPATTDGGGQVPESPASTGDDGSRPGWTTPFVNPPLPDALRRAGTSPPARPSPPAPVPAGTCGSSRPRGRAPVAVRAAVRRSGRLVVTARVPGASSRRPVRLVLQGRNRCGAWRTLGRTSASSPAARVTIEHPGAVDTVRWRSVRRGRTAFGPARPVQ